MSKKSTTKEFIKKVIEIHGDKYDYSKVKYINSKIKILIYCKKCNKYFKQIPSSHLREHGCLKCAVINNSNKQRSTAQEFIEKAIKIHEDKYDYSKIIYKNSKIKVLIICKKHKKEFKQTPFSHLQGQGCPKCVGKHKTTKEIIKQFRKIHGNKYNYSKVNYRNNKIKILIYCKKCNKYFKQTPSGHLNGYGCPKCGFEKTAKSKTLTTNQFIEKAIKIHGDKYDYFKVNYINHKIKIIIFCKKCNKFFEQMPYIHLQGFSCSFCKNKNENKVGKLLLNNFSTFKITHNKLIYKYIGLDKKEHKRYCDFYLQKKDKIIIVEYDGRQHEMPVNFNGMSQEKAERRFIIQQFIDEKDAEFCRENNILLYRIKYNENKEKSILKIKDILKNTIKI